MLSRTEKFVKNFGIECSRKEAISAFFEPLLESSASAHPSAAYESPPTGALFLSAVCSFNAHDYNNKAQRLSQINDCLRDHDPVYRFLLLLSSLPTEPKAAEAKKALVSLTPLTECLPLFPSTLPESIPKTKPDAEGDAGLKRYTKTVLRRGTPSPDQGIDLEESPRSVQSDELEPLSFNETLIALHPERTWIRAPKSEVVSCLERLVNGHESWLFTWREQKGEFVLKDGAFVEGISPTAFRSSIQPVLNASNCLVRLEKSSESKQVHNSQPLLAFKYALSNAVRKKRDEANSLLCRDEHAFFRSLHDVKRLCREITLLTDWVLPLTATELTCQDLVDNICDAREMFGMDTSLVKTVSDLLTAVCNQLNRSLDNWLSTGVAESNSFITSDKADSSSVKDRIQSREIWRTDYGASFLPFGLITVDLSREIIAVGKVRRLAIEWKEFRNSFDDQHDANIDTAQAAKALAICDENQLDLKADDFRLQLVYSIQSRIRSSLQDPCLIACLAKVRKTFQENLLLLRRVFFQEDRTLAAPLNVALHHLLLESDDFDSHSPSPMRLNSLLDAALDDAHYDGQLAQRFSFVLARAQTGGLLAKLALSYDLPYPVNLMISPATVDGYAQVWRLFAELGIAHTSLMKVRQIMFINGAVEGEMRFLLARFTMINFVTSLQAYFWHQVTKVVWEQYQTEFERAKSVDDLYVVHKSYLSAILGRCFLGPKAISMMFVLTGCLDSIVTFCAAISNTESALSEATKASMAFSKTALLFVKATRNLIKANYEPWLEDLLLRLDMSEFYTRQDL